MTRAALDTRQCGRPSNPSFATRRSQVRLGRFGSSRPRVARRMRLARHTHANSDRSESARMPHLSDWIRHLTRRPLPARSAGAAALPAAGGVDHRGPGDGPGIDRRRPGRAGAAAGALRRRAVLAGRGQRLSAPAPASRCGRAWRRRRCCRMAASRATTASACAARSPTTRASRPSARPSPSRPRPMWATARTSMSMAWSPAAPTSTASSARTRSARSGAPTRCRLRAAPRPLPHRLRQLPELRARLLQRLPPDAARPAGPGAVPRRLHLREPVGQPDPPAPRRRGQHPAGLSRAPRAVQAGCRTCRRCTATGRGPSPGTITKSTTTTPASSRRTSIPPSCCAAPPPTRPISSTCRCRAGCSRAPARCASTRTWTSAICCASTCWTTASTAPRSPARGSTATLAGAAGCKELREPGRRPCSAARRRTGWARASPDSRARWNLIGQQTLFAPMDEQPGADLGTWTDGWDGYPLSRQKVLQQMQAAKLRQPGSRWRRPALRHRRRRARRPGTLRLRTGIASEFVGTSLSAPTRARRSYYSALPRREPAPAPAALGPARLHAARVRPRTP
jgi:hypothetical protein